MTEVYPPHRGAAKATRLVSLQECEKSQTERKRGKLNSSIFVVERTLRVWLRVCVCGWVGVAGTHGFSLSMGIRSCALTRTPILQVNKGFTRKINKIKWGKTKSLGCESQSESRAKVISVGTGINNNCQCWKTQKFGIFIYFKNPGITNDRFGHIFIWAHTSNTDDLGMLLIIFKICM